MTDAVAKIPSVPSRLFCQLQIYLTKFSHVKIQIQLLEQGSLNLSSKMQYCIVVFCEKIFRNKINFESKLKINKTLLRIVFYENKFIRLYSSKSWKKNA